MKNLKLELKDIEYEIKFLELFGYKLLEMTDNHFVITDEFDKNIGFIQLINEGYDNVPKYSYHTEINSDKIEFLKNRSMYSPEETTYHFIAKKENKTKANIALFLGKEPQIIILGSDGNNFHMYRHQDNSLYCSVTSKTSKLSTTESWSICSDENAQKASLLTWSLYYNDADAEVNANNNKVRISMTIRDQNPGTRPYLRMLIENKGKDLRCGALTTQDNLDDVFIEYETALQTFTKFRQRLTSIVPFEKDIIKIILERNDGKTTPILDFLLNSIDNKKEKTKRTNEVTTTNQSADGANN